VKVLRTLGPAKTRKRRKSLLSAPPAGAGDWGRRLWWSARGVGLAAAVIALAAAALFGFERLPALPALSVTAVEVEGNRLVAADEVRRLSGVAAGEPLLSVSLDRVRSGVLRHPWLADAVVARRLPGSLRIRVRERVPLAVLSLGGTFALVDGEGVVLTPGLSGTGSDRYPIISGTTTPCRPGDAAFEARPALAALAALVGRGGVAADRISEVTVSTDGRILVSLTGSGTVLVMGSDDPEGQADRLARLAAAGAFDLRAAGYDLRFAGRVVRLPDRQEEQDGKQDGAKKPGKGGKANGQG
jgi:cell division protein FtsQ